MSIGTITLTNGSVTVTGASTQFKKEVEKGDVIVAVVGEVTYTSYVKSVENDTSLTLVKKYDGPTQSGLAYTAIPRAAMQQITAQLASDTAKALRGLNYDKENWQAVFSQSRNIIVKLPDGSTYEGPSWLKISDLLKEVDTEKLEVLAKQIHEDAVQVSADKVSANASATSSAKSATTADECAKKACECATKASQSEVNAKTSAANAKASETKSISEANRAKKEADRAEQAADDAVAGGIKPSDLTQTITKDKLKAPSNLAVNTALKEQDPRQWGFGSVTGKGVTDTSKDWFIKFVDSPTIKCEVADSQLLRNLATNSSYNFQYSAINYFAVGGTFGAICPSHLGIGVKIVGGYRASGSGNIVLTAYDLYTDKNTSIDPNGVLTTKQDTVTLTTNDLAKETGNSHSKVMTQKAVSDEIARLDSYMDYALVDFGTATKGDLLTRDNPFGDTPVITLTEFLITSSDDKQVWTVIGTTTIGDSCTGEVSGYVKEIGLRVSIGNAGIMGVGTGRLNMFVPKNAFVSALCRMHVWKIKGGN